MTLAAERSGSQVVSVPRGHPGELRAAAERLRGVTASSRSTALVRGTAVRDVDIAWSGPAAAAAKSEVATLSARCGAVLPQLETGGTVLRTYADELERAQAAARRLGARADAALAEHAHEVAAAEALLPDPALRAAAVRRAEQRRADRLAAVGRDRARVQEDLAAAAARCAAVLERLTPVGGDAAGTRLLEGLPFTVGLIGDALRPPQEPAQPSEPDWWAAVGDAATDSAAWAWNHLVVPMVNTAADVVEAAAEHPEDVVGIGLGVGQIVIGAGGQVGGLALDATGVGAVVGVPVHVASAGLIASGAFTATASAVQLGRHAAANDSMLLKEVKLKEGSRGMGGDPLPASQRPPAAPSTWLGRIANDGNGVVWQRPPDMCPPPTICTPNSLRIVDPGTKRFKGPNGDRVEVEYPFGYTRFYNSGGQPLKLNGKPGSEPETHLPIRPDGTYDLPQGWNPPS
ncbi:hypothetical protein [Intrasporangium calvum]|uniref:hypothetical protein n=1 Tax=Intrasporangium calvum TaxID=53358 RepID=UPI00123791B0|nr:hypothetical protein [Intrasporangium calvum]